jgi:hypothetical protein
MHPQMGMGLLLRIPLRGVNPNLHAAVMRYGNGTLGAERAGACV